MASEAVRERSISVNDWYCKIRVTKGTNHSFVVDQLPNVIKLVLTFCYSPGPEELNRTISLVSQSPEMFFIRTPRARKSFKLTFFSVKKKKK